MSSIRLLVLSVATVCILAGYRSYGRERPIPPRGDAMVEKFLARDADLLAGQVFEAAATRAEWQAFRPRLKAELFQVLGLWPVPERTPLHARVTGTLDREGPVVIEKIHFQSRPGLFVTGISGGGAATFWIAAADDRVACAAPASGMSDLESYVNHKIISRRSPASHRDGPIFLNVLRVLDVPAALGLLAPRPLTLIGAKGDAWSLTRALYERAGAATKLDCK
jgi:hypothetical protein